MWIDHKVHALLPALRLVAVLDLEWHSLVLAARPLPLLLATILVEEVEEEEEHEEEGRGQDEPLGDRPQPIQVQPFNVLKRLSGRSNGPSFISPAIRPWGCPAASRSRRRSVLRGWTGWR